jgi:hypothetical protein
MTRKPPAIRRPGRTPDIKRFATLVLLTRE